jgi:hypothetical protein
MSTLRHCALEPSINGYLKKKKKKKNDTDQSHAAEDRETVDNFQAKINERGEDDHKVENVPTVAEEIRTQGSHFQDTFGRENGSENLEIKTRTNNFF